MGRSRQKKKPDKLFQRFKISKFWKNQEVAMDKGSCWISKQLPGDPYKSSLEWKLKDFNEILEDENLEKFWKCQGRFSLMIKNDERIQKANEKSERPLRKKTKKKICLKMFWNLLRG